jgi:hypothetical protein
LNDAQELEVKEMLQHSQDRCNWRDKKSVGFNFDQIVTEDALSQHFGYCILAGKIPLDKKGNPSKKATAGGETSGCTEKPSKKIARKKKSSNPSTEPGGAAEGPSQKKKKKQSTTPQPMPHLVGRVDRPVGTSVEEVLPNATPTAQNAACLENAVDPTMHNPLGDVLTISGVVPGERFTGPSES